MKCPLLPLICTCICATTALAQDRQLQIYLWNKTSELNPAVFTPLYAPKVRVNALQAPLGDPGDSGRAAAQYSAQAVIQEYYDGGYFWPRQDEEPGHYSMFLLGFGVWDAEAGVDGFSACSLFDVHDAVSPTPDWTPPAHTPRPWLPEEAMQPYKQPWMNHARARCKTWMEAFLDQYSQTFYDLGGNCPVPLPIPDRVAFDVEVGEDMCSPYDVNDTRILEAVCQDPRWGIVEGPYPQSGMEVPGFPGKNMEDLWHDARDRYDPAHSGVTWINGTLYDYLQSGPTGNEIRKRSPRDPALRRYFLWYNWVCQTAVDAALEEVAYAPIRAHWPEHTPRMSNFAHTKVDGAQDTFGWFPRATPPSESPSTFTPETHAVRAPMPRSGPDGLYHFSTDLLEPGSDPAYPSNIWLYERQITHAEISSPEAFLWPQWGWEDRHNYYVPETQPDYQETIRSCSLRCQRQWIESILNSRNDSQPMSGPADISPDFIYPDDLVAWWHIDGHDVDGSQITFEHFRRQLALFRAKDLHEAQIFDGQYDSDPNRPWNNVPWIYKQVYSPKLLSYGVKEGCTADSYDPARLWYTLRDPGHDTVTITSGGGDDACGAAGVASIEIVFTNLNEARPNAVGLVLNLECAVNKSQAFGTIKIKRPGGWEPVAIHDAYDDPIPHPPGYDDANDPNRMLYFTGADSSGLFTSRRSIDIPITQIDGNTITLWIAMTDPNDSADFKAVFDLAQFYWVTGTSADTGTPNLDLSADYTRDGLVDIHDAMRYLTYFTNGVPAADYNHDGVIDATDFAAYLAAYGH